MTALESSRAELAAKRAYLSRTNRLQTEHLTEIPPEDWPSAMHGPTPAGQRRTNIWRSRDFLVQIFEEGEHIRLSICRTQLDDHGRWKDGITWDQLQQIKNEVGYAFATAVEVYPPADQVVNVANMRHLWILPSHPPYLWGKWRKHQPTPPHS